MQRLCKIREKMSKIRVIVTRQIPLFARALLWAQAICITIACMQSASIRSIRIEFFKSYARILTHGTLSNTRFIKKKYQLGLQTLHYSTNLR